MVKTDREYRSIEMRADDKEEYIVRGYATTFNKPYSLYKYRNYEVMEQIDSHAFDECDMSDVILQFDHEGRVFARTRNKTLTLKTDEHGLLVTAYLGGTEQGRSLYEDIKGGYVDRMSFAFTVQEQECTYTEEVDSDKETCLRTIKKIGKVYDVSAVSIPANDQTSISARKFSDGVIQELEAERLQRAKLKLKIKLMED